MLTPIEELKIQAKRLHKQHIVPVELLILSQDNPLQLKHCQRFLARKIGFRDWEHARQVLSCNDHLDGQDNGRFWHSPACDALLNTWCRSYNEALTVQAEAGGVILPYRSQYIVADNDYLTLIGVSIDDPRWQQLRYNWCEGEQAIRLALALQRVQAISASFR